MHKKTFVSVMAPAILASALSHKTISAIKNGYENLYTQLTPFHKLSASMSDTDTQSFSRSIGESLSQTMTTSEGSTDSTTDSTGMTRTLTRTKQDEKTKKDKAVDIFEEIMLNKHFFSKISSYIAENIRNLLKEKESTFHKWIKPADMLAADSECWRQCRAGTRDPYFKEAIEKFDKQLSDNVYQLPPLFQELHDYYLRYAKFAIKDID